MTSRGFDGTAIKLDVEASILAVGDCGGGVKALRVR
jgi:hypothetical protein